MKQTPGNPPSNQLGPGLNTDQVRNAVDKSGYPLQTVVSTMLRRSFGVQEEWSYLDRDSGELRSTDIRAAQPLFEWREPQPRVRPQLTLLVECKQSQLPYLFFESEPPRSLLDHPRIVGLHKSTIQVSTDDDASTWTFTIIHALGLQEHAFQTTPVFCNTFSKCVRKGSELELSGAAAYGGLVLPLIKALEHLGTAEAPPATAWYFDGHLSIGLGVLDAPMIVARANPTATELELIPWVRVLRHEYSKEGDHLERDRLWAIDVVHRDYLETYLTVHLAPFAKEFATRVLAHPTEVATGQAFAAGMGADSWTAVEERLKPRQFDASIKRTRAVGRNILRLLSWKDKDK